MCFICEAYDASLTKGIATRSKILLVDPGLTTSNKKLLGAPGLTTRNKDATRVSWPYY